jgi:hypothetical protein
MSEGQNTADRSAEEDAGPDTDSGTDVSAEVGSPSEPEGSSASDARDDATSGTDTEGLSDTESDATSGTESAPEASAATGAELVADAATAAPASSEAEDDTSAQGEASARGDTVVLDEVEGSVGDRLAEAGVDVAAVVDRTVSYRELVDAGVDEALATRIRRAYGLRWSFRTGDDDLHERSSALRGLDDEEREWIAASAEDWEDRLAESAEAARRRRATDERELPERPTLTPLTTIPGIDDEYADLLAEAGIVSVRTLAVADPMKVATTLDIEPNRVTSWHWRAREQTGAFNLLSE